MHFESYHILSENPCFCTCSTDSVVVIVCS